MIVAVIFNCANQYAVGLTKRLENRSRRYASQRIGECGFRSADQRIAGGGLQNTDWPLGLGCGCRMHIGL
jgi:hypothetical protein